MSWDLVFTFTLGVLSAAALLWHITSWHREEIARHERYVMQLLSDLKRMEDRIHARTLTDYAVLRGAERPAVGPRFHGMDDETEAQIEELRGRHSMG